MNLLSSFKLQLKPVPFPEVSGGERMVH